MSTHTAEPVAQAARAANSRHTNLARAGLLLIFLAVYAAAIFSPALLDDADATHAEAAREMAAGGDFVTLHLNGVRYLEKAPLPYWGTALALRLFGMSAAAAHLPLVLGIGLLAWLAWRWSRRAFGEPAAEFAALFTLTAAGVFLFTRILIPEVLLTLLIGAALYCFLTALEGTQPWRWYAGYACTAAAVLTKGLVALVFVGGTAAVYLLSTGEWRRWREFRLPTGLLLLLALAAPWHLLAGLRNRGFFWFYFVNEHFLRFLGRRYPKDYNKLPPLAYWTLHLAWLFPWSLFAPLVVRERPRRRPLSFAERTRLLCWIWAGLVLLFFAFSTNQEYYTFPAYLPLLLLAADAVARETERPSRWATAAYAALAMAGAAAAAALFSELWASRQLPFVPDIGAVLVERGVGGYTLSMSHFFDLTGPSFAALRAPAALAAAALLAGTLAALALRLRGRRAAAVWTTGATMALLLVAAHLALVRFEPYLSSQPLAAQLAPVAGPAARVMIYGDQAFGSSLLFYLQRPIALVNGRSTSMEFGSHYPDAPAIFLSDADLLGAWAGPQPVFLFVPRERREEVERLLPRQRRLVAQSSGKVIYSNQ